MCRIYASTPQEEYVQKTRSIRINGVVTSIRLEMRFWHIIERMSEREGLTVGAFLSTLYNEAIGYGCEVNNFASLLRVACITSLEVETGSRSCA
ncbi:ribbon-helix-helix domain-containing protein [Halodesulfovibrio sp.]|uniref:ribbon-helix-helix domain-containing protein n=1 Tax=Halodesulfovibrio sp. TaxID=1912772 RepID=UPI0025D39F24|nr:ribbon-helix-helix domain-containing protein [Halodesulfovibrio sp.]MCT4534452.1 ribbon-helix-helix domain-containing protein [Halodesulfovibrio sp.]